MSGSSDAPTTCGLCARAATDWCPVCVTPLCSDHGDVHGCTFGCDDCGHLPHDGRCDATVAVRGRPLGRCECGAGDSTPTTTKDATDGMG